MHVVRTIRVGGRVAIAALFAASGLLFGLGGQEEPAGAACMAPVIEVSPRSASPGALVTITGYGWRHGCNDTVDCPTGGPCPANSDAPPRTGIRLRFSQGRTGDVLGVADADHNARFTHVATVPQWAKKGAATVAADDVITGFSVAPAGGTAGSAGFSGSGGGLGGVSVGLGGLTPDIADGTGQLAETGAETVRAVALALLLIAAGSTLRRLSLAP